MIQSLLIPGAKSSLMATTPHQAGNPYPSSGPLGQPVGSVSIMLEPLPVSPAGLEYLPSKGGGLEEV